MPLRIFWGIPKSENHDLYFIKAHILVKEAEMLKRKLTLPVGKMPNDSKNGNRKK